MGARSRRHGRQGAWGCTGTCACVLVSLSNLLTSDADVLIPRHNNRMRPEMATSSRNLVLVTNANSALDGGNEPLAAFQLMPPLGRSMATMFGGGSTAPPEGGEKKNQGKKRADGRERSTGRALSFVIASKPFEGGRSGGSEGGGPGYATRRCGIGSKEAAKEEKKKRKKGGVCHSRAARIERVWWWCVVCLGWSRAILRDV